LLQLACFTGRNAKYNDEAQDISAWLVDDPLAFLDEACRAIFLSTASSNISFLPIW
jgi:hypothetical protein